MTNNSVAEGAEHMQWILFVRYHTITGNLTLFMQPHGHTFIHDIGQENNEVPRIRRVTF